MNSNKIGIDDISFYLPSFYINNIDIYENRVKIDKELAERILKSINYTEQSRFRIPYYHEDTVTMGAESCRELLRNNSFNLEDLSYFFCGTETSVDMSKSVSNYIMGLLQKDKISLPNSLLSFQTQHACAGGTVAMFSALALLKNSENPTEKGIVIASDIAKYSLNSTAEITQGAGAVSILLSKSPSLFEVDLSKLGYYSFDVDDFFRPNYSETPSVKGKYSVECYKKALCKSFENLAKKYNKNKLHLFNDCDYFVFHVPFVSMGKLAYSTLLSNIFKDERIIKEQESKFLYPPELFINAESGNTYNASIYMKLISLIYQEYKNGVNLASKKIAFFSYGSGNVMISAIVKVSENYKKVVSKWNLEEKLKLADKMNFLDYEIISKINKHKPFKLDKNKIKNLKQGSYYLKEIRKDGFRIYDVK